MGCGASTPSPSPAAIQAATQQRPSLQPLQSHVLPVVHESLSRYPPIVQPKAGLCGLCCTNVNLDLRRRQAIPIALPVQQSLLTAMEEVRCLRIFCGIHVVLDTMAHFPKQVLTRTVSDAKQLLAKQLYMTDIMMDELLAIEETLDPLWAAAVAQVKQSPSSPAEEALRHALVSRNPQMQYFTTSHSLAQWHEYYSATQAPASASRQPSPPHPSPSLIPLFDTDAVPLAAAAAEELRQGRLFSGLHLFLESAVCGAEALTSECTSDPVDTAMKRAADLLELSVDDLALKCHMEELRWPAWRHAMGAVACRHFHHAVGGFQQALGTICPELEGLIRPTTLRHWVNYYASAVWYLTATQITEAWSISKVPSTLFRLVVDCEDPLQQAWQMAVEATWAGHYISATRMFDTLLHILVSRGHLPRMSDHCGRSWVHFYATVCGTHRLSPGEFKYQYEKQAKDDEQGNA